MDTKLLEVFLAVVHTGSISAAARRLNFSQPTVSQQMKALERIMEVELFTREGGRIELTAAGRALQGYAETTLSSWRFVCEQVREAGGRDDLVELSLASFPSASAALVPEAIAALLAADDRLRVKVLDAEPPASYDLLRSGQVNAIMSFSYPEDEPTRGQTELPILDEEFVLLVSEDHPLAGQGVVDLEDAADSNWVGGCPKCRQELLTVCRERGFVPEILCSTDDPTLTRVMVTKGIGVAMRPALSVVGQPAPGMVPLSIAHGTRRQVSVVVPDADADKPEILALHAALRTAARELVAQSTPAQQARIHVED
ncbi:MAG TPA: LysR family transcriptional regulator [Propionibacterium sp.]|jgi:DNA-binding transcriptional LysR family regulator|nr:LysR family transcriptional regulator [Propionibacterium sp.]